MTHKCVIDVLTTKRSTERFNKKLYNFSILYTFLYNFIDTVNVLYGLLHVMNKRIISIFTL